MSRQLVTSSSNPRLKAVRRLRRASQCNGAGVFLVEGHRQLACALEARARIREIFIAPELFLGASDPGLVVRAEARGTRVTELTPAAFESISGNVRADGLLAVVERWPLTLKRPRLGSNPFVLVADRVERPGNLGTIVRAACAAGADALVTTGHGTDPFHPEVVRGSVGTLFKLPVAHADTPEAIGWLRDHQLRIVVATPDADHDHWSADYSRAAIVVGNERYGVDDAWLNAADERVRIPMPGPADSLNVAVAAGIVLFEAARQRLP